MPEPTKSGSTSVSGPGQNLRIRRRAGAGTRENSLPARAAEHS